MLKKWKKDWPHIKTIIRVTRYREVLGKNSQAIQTVHYYVTNSELSAQEYTHYIRAHWWIENKLHHVKDNAFLEDFSTKRINPYIYSSCIDICLNIMRNKGCKNIKGTIYKNSLDLNIVLNNIKNIL